MFQASSLQTYRGLTCRTIALLHSNAAARLGDQVGSSLCSEAECYVPAGASPSPCCAITQTSRPGRRARRAAWGWRRRAPCAARLATTGAPVPLSQNLRCAWCPIALPMRLLSCRSMKLPGYPWAHCLRVEYSWTALYETARDSQAGWIPHHTPDGALRIGRMYEQAPVKKSSALHPKPEKAPVFKGVTWSATNGQWRAQAWDGKKVCLTTT